MKYLTGAEEHTLREVSHAVLQRLKGTANVSVDHGLDLRHESSTKGAYIVLGQLASAKASLGIWLDRWSGYRTPKLWYGFSTRTEEVVQRLARTGKRRFGKRLSYRSDRLPKASFGRPIVEDTGLWWYGVYDFSFLEMTPGERSTLVDGIVDFYKVIAKGRFAPAEFPEVNPRRARRTTTMNDCDPAVREDLMYRYDGHCQVCSEQIVLPDGRPYLEGHHIYPRAKRDSLDHPSNVVVLCPNHHLEFDRLALAIEPGTDGKLSHCNQENPSHGKRINCDPSHKLNGRCLNLAWERFRAAGR